MKKFLLMTALLFSFISVNAQTAIEESKVFDNMYAGVTAGAIAPLDFNSVFPVNAAIGLKIGKEITPVIGFEVEGLAAFNDNHFGDFNTGIKATNLGTAATLNLTNIFAGYNGKPRPIEFKTNTGIGWLHTYGDNTNGDNTNALTAKTALDVVWNIGNKRAISVVVSPGVYWNLSGFDETINSIRFNKHRAQFALMGSLVWHFKTSNGTRHFKKYDVGTMTSEIARLNEELAKKPTEVEKIVEKVVVREKTTIVDNNVTYVFFAQNSDALTDDAKKALDAVPAGEYDIDGYASPEGAAKYNMQLSKHRAEAVARYLADRGVIVKSIKGHGVAFGDATNRMVTIKAAVACSI